MADFTLAKPIFGGKKPRTSTSGNIAYALATQRVALAQPVDARFLRLTFADPALPAAQLAIAGLGGFTIAR